MSEQQLEKIESGGEPTPERPAWLPEKFESGEAFAQSYAEAEKEMARLRNDSQRQEREFTEALQRIEASTAQRQPAYNPQQDPLLSAAQRAWDDGDMATFMAINAQVSQVATRDILKEELKDLREAQGGATNADKEIAFRLAEQQVAPIWGDRWSADLAPKLNDLIAANPSLLPATPSVEGYAQALTSLAKQIDYDRLSAAQTAQDQERAAKLQANTLGASTARVPTNTDEKKQAWEEIKGADNRGWSNLVGG